MAIELSILDRNTYYVYTLSWPSGEVFYVGKGTRARLLDHESEASRGVQSRKCDVIREIWASGNEVRRAIVYSTPIECDALIYEWALVNMVYCSSKLTNGRYAEKVTFSPFKRLESPKGSKEYQLLQLVQHRKHIRLSIEGLARRSNVSARTIRNAEEGKKVSFDTAVQILQGINSALTDVGKSSVSIDDLGLVV